MVNTVTATSLALDTTLSLQLQSESVSAGTNTGAEGGSGDRFGTAVLINLKTRVAISLPPPDPKGEQALATLKATVIEAAGFSKKDAADRLTRALNELKILKLLGGGINGAKQAAQIAKEIGVAASEYAQSGGAVPADVAAASVAPDATASTPTTTGNTDAPAAPPPAPPASAGTAASAATQPQATALSAALGGPDAFFQAANEALSELHRYLQQILPPLETSQDKKTRNAAHKAQEDFDKAIGTTLAAENLQPASSGAAAPAAAPIETTTATIDTSVTVAVATVPYQPVNLSA